MPKLRHSFPMNVPPQEAQEMFVRDILPELARDTGFILREQRPGQLEFRNGPGQALEPGTATEHRYSALTRWLSRRITVTFEPAPSGTTVAMVGGCPGRVRQALVRLGAPGRWPAKANDPQP